MLHRIIRVKGRFALGPNDGTFKLHDGGVIVPKLFDHGFHSEAGVSQVIYQQNLTCNLATWGGDVTGNIKLTLFGTRLSTVRARGHDGQRLIKNARQNIARPQAPAGQTQNGVELPTRAVHLQGELFNQVVVFHIAHIKVLAVFGQHVGAPNG